MKKWIYLLIIVTSIGLFSACQDITVGYLMVDETAGYPKDTMIVITKAENELQRLKNIEASFYLQSQEIQDNMEDLQNQIYDIQDFTDYWDAIEEAMDDPDFNWDEYDKFMAEMNEKYGITPLQNELDRLRADLNNLATEMGIESLDILKNDIEEWQNKVDFELPYLSSNIDGVLGTDIMYYRVVEVKSENQKNAAKFMDYVEVKGKGCVSVKYNPDVPAGAYLLTLEVKNEGRTRLIEDVFTVVLKDVPAEEPIPMPGE